MDNKRSLLGQYPIMHNGEIMKLGLVGLLFMFSISAFAALPPFHQSKAEFKALTKILDKQIVEELANGASIIGLERTNDGDFKINLDDDCFLFVIKDNGETDRPPSAGPEQFVLIAPSSKVCPRKDDLEWSLL